MATTTPPFLRLARTLCGSEWTQHVLVSGESIVPEQLDAMPNATCTETTEPLASLSLVYASPRSRDLGTLTPNADKHNTEPSRAVNNK
jgi:hypothetical protein